MTHNAGGHPEPNCMMGYRVHNRHNNCPYSLLCAVCDIDDEQPPPNAEAGDVDLPDRT